MLKPKKNLKNGLNLEVLGMAAQPTASIEHQLKPLIVRAMVNWRKGEYGMAR